MSLRGLTFITTFILLAAIPCFSQTYNTYDNNFGDWDNTATWVGGTNSTTAGQLNIYGKVERVGDLGISNDLNVVDTLWIHGNLNMNGGSSLTINSNAILIIDGDLNATSFWFFANFNVDIENSGKVVVTGDVNIEEFYTGGEADVDNNNDFYVYGDITETDGGEFLGSNGDESDLLADDPDLYDLVNAGTLPVTFALVKTETNGYSVRITWITASEKNNDFFTVQRAEDGINFSDIGTVDGSGNSNRLQTYTYSDDLSENKAYYRIMQTDFDGAVSYSSVVLSEGHRRAASFSVYPNPSYGDVRIAFDINKSNTVLCRVFDANGAVIFADELADIDNGSLDLTGLNKGFYFIEVQTQEETHRKKLIVR